MGLTFLILNRKGRRKKGRRRIFNVSSKYIYIRLLKLSELGSPMWTVLEVHEALFLLQSLPKSRAAGEGQGPGPLTEEETRL